MSTSLIQVLNTLKNSSPLTLPQSEVFIKSLSRKLQRQVIAAIYIGRNHMHSDNWEPRTTLSTSYYDDVPEESFSTIIYEKNTSISTYIDSVQRCALNEGFDLNNL